MPRVAIKKKEYMKKDLSQMIAGKMYGRYRQKDIADKLDISQQAFGKRLENGNFTYRQLIIMFDMLEFSDEEILKSMRISKRA